MSNESRRIQKLHGASPAARRRWAEFRRRDIRTMIGRVEAHVSRARGVWTISTT